jgi:hypothetical protein
VRHLFKVEIQALGVGEARSGYGSGERDDQGNAHRSIEKGPRPERGGPAVSRSAAARDRSSRQRPGIVQQMAWQSKNGQSEPNWLLAVHDHAVFAAFGWEA